MLSLSQSPIKASQPYFPRFRVRIFRAFALWNLLRPFPVGQKRQIDVAGQKLPRDNFCLSLVSQLPSPRG